jgi:DNA-binding GntR family transcriptional regulator
MGVRHSMTMPERPTSLADLVTNRLRREIVDGEFEFGQALSESKIAARYGVSRTPVRESFARLELEGLVRTEPQHGTFVLTVDRAEFAQISETRAIMEMAALRLAFERNRNPLLKKWKQAVTAMRAAMKAVDGKEYCRVDGEFHQLLFELADNPFLGSASQSFSAKMAAVRNRLGANPEHMRRSFREHVELLELVAKNQVEAAAKLLERHIRFKGESFWAVPAKKEKSRWEKIAELAE